MMDEAKLIKSDAPAAKRKRVVRAVAWHVSLIRTPPAILASRGIIRDTMLQHSRGIQMPNFARCHDADLRLLFDLYDTHCFDRQLGKSLAALGPSSLVLRFSNRLRSAGGKTIRRRAGGQTSFVIEISSRVLMCNYNRPTDTADICGLTCGDRLEALMRVMEHELIHLAEFLFDGRSRCSARPFQEAAAALFGHVTHQHAMTTPRDRVLAATAVRPGHRVKFDHDTGPVVGTVSRINQRATVLVEDPRGTRYTDGKRYVKFYVPVQRLKLA